jgi:hypothetical protein
MDEAAPLTLDHLLPEGIDGMSERLREEITAHRRTDNRIAWAAVGDDALKKIRGELKFDLATELAKAWVTVSELRAFRDEERHPRDVTEPYVLGKHEVELSGEPQLNIQIGGWSAPPVVFRYVLAAKFDAVELSIRNAAIIAARPGTCEITAVISFNGVDLHDPCRLAQSRLPGVFTPRTAIAIP